MSEQRSSALALEELERETHEPADHLRQWRSLGLIGTPGREELRLEDVERVRLIQLSVRRGIAIETIVRAEATEQDFLRHYLEQIFPSGIERSRSLAEAADPADADIVLVRRLAEIVGLTDAAETLRGEDVEVFRGWKIALGAGLTEEALLQLVR